MKALITGSTFKPRVVNVGSTMGAWVYVKHKMIKGPGYKFDFSEDRRFALVTRRGAVVGTASITIMEGKEDADD